MTGRDGTSPRTGAATLAAMIRPGRLLREFSGLGLQQAVYILYPLALLPIIAHQLGAADFGRLLFFHSLGAWGMMVIAYGFDLVGTREMLVDPAAQPRIAGSIWSTQAVLSLAVLAVLLAALPIVPAFQDYPLLLALTWVSSVVQALVPRWFFRARQRIQTLAWLEAVPKLVSLPVLWAALELWPHPVVAMAVFVVTHVVTLSLAAAAAVRSLGPVRLATDGVWHWLKAGFALFVSGFAHAVNAMGSIVIFGLFTSPAAVGSFAAAERIVRAAGALLHIIPMTLYPVMVTVFKLDRSRVDRMVWLSVATVCLCALAGGAALWVLVPWFVPLLFGEGFEDAIPLMRMMLVLLPLGATAYVIGVQGLVPAGRMRGSAIVVVLGALVNLALVFVLTPRLGAEGMVMALIGSAVVIAAGHLLLYHRLRRDHAREAGAREAPATMPERDKPPADTVEGRGPTS